MDLFDRVTWYRRNTTRLAYEVCRQAWQLVESAATAGHDHANWKERGFLKVATRLQGVYESLSPVNNELHELVCRDIQDAVFRANLPQPLAFEFREHWYDSWTGALSGKKGVTNQLLQDALWFEEMWQCEVQQKYFREQCQQLSQLIDGWSKFDRPFGARWVFEVSREIDRAIEFLSQIAFGSVPPRHNYCFNVDGDERGTEPRTDSDEREVWAPLRVGAH